MSWRIEKIDKDHEDLVWSGGEQGIASSPHKGTANLQNVNIQTEINEVICSFSRVNDMPSYAGNIDVTTSGGGSSTFTITGLTSFIPVGTPITVSSGSNLTPGNYYINSVTGSTGSQTVTLTSTFNGAGLTTSAGGSTAPFTTFTVSSAAVDYCIEEYFDGTQLQFRYFILESAGYVWVLDTGATWSTYGWTPVNLDEQKIGSTDLGLINGWIHVFQGNDTWVKMTCALGVDFGGEVGTWFNLPSSGAYSNPHPTLTDKSNTLNIGNGNYIVTDFPNSSTSAAVANVFGNGSLTFSGSLVQLTTLFQGSFPVVGQTITFLSSGTNPTGMSPTTIYYVIATNYSAVLGQFEYSTSIGGSAVTPSGGTGTFFFDSYSPRLTQTYVLNSYAFTLPPSEIISSITQANVEYFVGTQGTNLYTWDGISFSWTSLIPLPEANTTSLLTVNNMVYAFAGNKGNIYITNGSTASLVISVPDYCAGIPGLPSTYIEPYFVWGGTAYIRGRIYFSIQDQTPVKTGNCGGIWSFVPTENFYIGQDTGISLRMENTNSYGNLNGIANVIIPNQNQESTGVQYFTEWTANPGGLLSFVSSSTLIYIGSVVLAIGDELTIGSGIGGLTGGNYFIVGLTAVGQSQSIAISTTLGGGFISGFSSGSTNFFMLGINGIDTSGTFPSMTAIIETDAIPTGTMLNKKTFAQLEYKLASPLLSGESVQLYYRLNLTDAWISCGTVVAEPNSLSGYFISAFQNTQWLQLQANLIPNGTSTFSGNRITEIRVR